ncbi:MAG TPA: hypothetical protein VFR47_27625 [Anaerolineales bacterium]|nr:hypothetical protein [Anaerolineales bacterium]
MEKQGTLTKILAIAGTVLVWLPILAPIFFSAILFIQEQIFRFDYLMPAELFPAILLGGGLLIWAALRAHSHGKLIGWSLGIAAALLVGAQVLAEVTGLASGQTEPTGWLWALVIGALVAFVLAILGVAVGGILLLRDLFRPRQLPA